MNRINGQFAIFKKTGRVVQIMSSLGETIEFCDVMKSQGVEYLTYQEFDLLYSLVPLKSQQENAIIRMRELANNNGNIILVLNGKQLEFKEISEDVGFSELMKALEFFSNSNYPVDKLSVDMQESQNNLKKMVINKGDQRMETKRIKRDRSSSSIDEKLGEELGQKSSNQDMIILDPDSRYSWDNLILAPKTKEQLNQVLVKLELNDFLHEEWGLKELTQDANGQRLNFQGPPGTGKTLAAKSIGYKLNKKILQVDYSQLYSKWVGETGKNIQKYFQKSKKEDLILFFDEADALLSSRASGSNENHGNTNQNIFMQELDRHQGLVILTTNFFSNYDAAMFRRLEHVSFFLPEAEQRLDLFKTLIPKKINLLKDFNLNTLVVGTVGFSGGDIKNVIQQTITKKATQIRLLNSQKDPLAVAAILRQYVFIENDFIEEINIIKQNKKSYLGVVNSDKKLGLVN